MANRLYNRQVSPKGYKSGGMTKAKGAGMGAYSSVKDPKVIKNLLKIPLKAKTKEGRVKKMGGGMMKKYNKGGGADTGTVGEMKSKFGVTLNKVRRYAKKIKDKDRLTERDISTVKELLPKKMGGGMMQRPMGMMKKGSMVKARGGGMARTKPTKMF